MGHSKGSTQLNFEQKGRPQIIQVRSELETCSKLISSRGKYSSLNDHILHMEKFNSIDCLNSYFEMVFEINNNS